ncbi:DUF6941 family protein [Paenibacillus xylanexedens]|uniref:DUF6941 family protein n=1 Tax=Paenibacillus xylanexedens TaxID=528191 RepID=UPI0011A3B0EC|nr:hypothetical protein [Paenibacillus xylanexedens]
MLRITSFTYCEDSKPEQSPTGPRLSISNPFASLLPAFVPGSFSFSVCIGIAGIGPGEEHKLQYIFRSSDNSVEPLINTGEVQFNVNQEPTLQSVPVDHQGVVLSMDFKNTVFRKNGEYISDIYMDGILVASYPIMVHGRETV